MSARIQVIDGSAPLARGVSVALIHGASLGGATGLTSDLIDVLIDVEKRGLHIVLIVAEEADARGNVAAIARHVYCANEALIEPLASAWGREQVLRGKSLEVSDIYRSLRTLPTPPSRTLLRRVYRLFKGGQ